MENRFKLLREEEEARRKDINPKAKFGQKELCEELEKTCGFYIKLSKLKKLEAGHLDVKIDEELLLAYKKFFGVSTDWLIDISVETRQVVGNNAMVSSITGLTDNAINTLSLLKSKKYVNGNRFDYALHTLNMILDNYENTNLFDLIYHYLFGDYTEMGHYDEYGQSVYDGSQVFVSDRFLANQMEINTEYVDAAVLHMITKQLDYWKNYIKENRPANYGKLLPEKNTLLKQIEDKEHNKDELQEKLQWLYSLMEAETKKTPVDTKRLIELTESYRSMGSAIELTQRSIDEFTYTLKEIYHYTYERTDKNETT